MIRNTATKNTGKTALLFTAAMGLFIALGSAATVRADDPPKKSGGKAGFIVGTVTKTPDKDPKANPKPKQDQAKPDPNKGKQSPPKGN